MEAVLEKSAVQDPLEVLRSIVPEPDLVINVGAGEGFFYHEARRVWPEVEIWSFEPRADLLEVLDQYSGLKHSVFGTALGSHSERRQLNLTQARKSNSFLGFLPGNPLAKQHAIIGQQEVVVAPLDSFDARGKKKIVLKLDVQGWELEVLKGAVNTLKNVKALYVEVAFVPQYDGHPLFEEVDAWLNEHGFQQTYKVESSMPEVWADAVYVPISAVIDRPIRLNLGAGESKLEGYIPIDRKFGGEVYPLDYPDNSVDEIRASHILEHAGFAESKKWLREWHRVLKPGGLIKVAVPGFEKIVAMGKTDADWVRYLMGGQIDENDYHKSVWTERGLRDALWAAGFDGIKKWECTDRDWDTAAHPCSINLCGTKTSGEQRKVKIEACMSIPRIGWNDAWMSIMSSLAGYGIKLRTMNGAFWGQCLQREFEDCVKDSVEWILAIDYDSMVCSEALETLFREFRENPHIDALAGLQIRRNRYEALVTTKDAGTVPAGGEPFEAQTAHFGLTLLRVDRLVNVPKPWFWGQPDANGGWGDGRIDDDIWFWKQWKKTGNNIYVSTRARVGHLELVVSDYDANYNPVHMYVPGWRNLRMKGGCHGDIDDKSTFSPTLENASGGRGSGAVSECGDGAFASRYMPAVDGTGCGHDRNGHGCSADGDASGTAT